MLRRRDLVRAGRPDSAGVRGLRGLHVCVFHPDDADGRELSRQLQRIGCETQTFWPPLPVPPRDAAVVFIALDPDLVQRDFSWCEHAAAPPVIAVVNYENPTIIEMAMRLGAKGVISSPVRAFGLLSALVLARDLADELRRARDRIERLEAKLACLRTVVAAQSILSQQRGISLEDAYKVLRDRAMARRITVEEVAADIVHAHEVMTMR